jgi:hypothetical protein
MGNKGIITQFSRANMGKLMATCANMGYNRINTKGTHMEIAVTGARATTPQDNETIKKAVQAHTRANWHIGDAKGADSTATEQAHNQGDKVTIYHADKKLGKGGFAKRSMEMIDGAIALGATKLLAFPNKPCPTDCTPKKPFNGHGSGTWGTIAYAKKKGLEIELHPLTADAQKPDWLKQLSLL